MLHRLVPALVGVLALTACAGSDPAALPVPATSPSSTPSASASAPPPLPSPSSTDPAGRAVEEAVLAYFRGINTLLASGDPSAYDASYAPSCAPCKQFSQRVTGIYGKGQRAEGAVDIVEEITVTGTVTANAGAATVTFRVPAYRIVAADGSEVDSYPESRGTRIFTVVRGAGGLKVVSIQDPGA